MTLRLRITARAAAQIERADEWWRKNRLSVPGAVRDDLKAAFALLLLQPGIGEKLDSARLHGTRSLQLDRIRYDIYYRVHEPGHNAVRARAQLQLAELMLAQLPDLRASVATAAPASSS